MSRKKEMEFATWFKNEVKRQFPDSFYYKIPDTPGYAKFKPTKPFDSILVIDSKPIAIEFKYKEIGAIGIRDLRPSQVEGLRAIEKAGGLGYVIWEIRLGLGEYGVFFACFKGVQDRVMWSKGELIEIFNRRTSYNCPMLRNREYDLAEWVMSTQLGC